MSNENGTWGGKREGAGRKKSTPYTSKTQGIYCNTYELLDLKKYLAFMRCIYDNPLNGVDKDAGVGRLKYQTISNWMFLMMTEEDWEEMESCLKTDTFSRLEKEYKKRIDKHKSKKEKLGEAR